MKHDIVPVLLGADLNCYSMARAFHEAYGVKSHVFGKCELGTVRYSKIVDFSIIPPLDEAERELDTLVDFAKEQPGKPYIFGCTDEYALFIIKNKHILSEYFVCECPDAEQLPPLSDKTEFYTVCNRIGLPHPESVYVSSAKEAGVSRELPFEYPVVVKPSCSFKYWHHPFDGMRKVYIADSPADSERIIAEIFSSGYDGKIIIQKMIRGNAQYVATCFSQGGDVYSACVGRVLLGETTPKGIGNHVAIITEENNELFEMASRFLSETKYTGFSNFDAMRDENTGKYYLLEINPRQGRSNYYMSAAGANAAIAAVEKEKIGLVKNVVFWHSVPKKIVLDRCSDGDAAIIKTLVKEKKSFSSLFYPPDLCDPRRAAYVLAHNCGFFAKYREYENR